MRALPKYTEGGCPTIMVLMGSPQDEDQTEDRGMQFITVKRQDTASWLPPWAQRVTPSHFAYITVSHVDLDR